MDPALVNLRTLEILNAVEEMHKLGAEEINSLFRGGARSLKVDLERVAQGLPKHLMVFLMSHEKENSFDKNMKYVLRGVRLLYTLSELAFRNAVLGKILHEDSIIREQVLELVNFLLICLASYDKETELLEPKMNCSGVLTHTALSACTLHLLTVYISQEWSEVAPVILLHPQGHVFLDAIFDVITKGIWLFHTKLSTLNAMLWAKKATMVAAERYAYSIGQHCEAALQALQILCRCQNFKENILRHEELCKKGGVLKLVIKTLSLELPRSLMHSRRVVACISRLKSKALCMLVSFCESEPISFLDEVVGNSRTKEFALAVAQQVLGLLRVALLDEPTVDEEDQPPMGLVHITSMRLADIFSDDSNFRNFIMDGITKHLATVLAANPAGFQARWCGGVNGAQISVGERDALLVYDTFHAAGAAMLVQRSGLGLKSSPSLQEYNSGCTLSLEGPVPLHAQERSSLLVKLFANLFCFNPEICSADQKHRFFHLFLECLALGPLSPDDPLFFLTVEQTAVRICENLNKLIDYVVSLSSDAVNDEDLLLVSEFSKSLHEAICPAILPDVTQEPPVIGYVRESHEQKLKAMVEHRQQLERWQQLQAGADQLPAPGDKKISLITEAPSDGGSQDETVKAARSEVHDSESDKLCQKDTLNYNEKGVDMIGQGHQDESMSREDIQAQQGNDQNNRSVEEDKSPKLDDEINDQAEEHLQVDEEFKQSAYVDPSSTEARTGTEGLQTISKTPRKIKVSKHSDATFTEYEDAYLNSGWTDSEQNMDRQQYTSMESVEVTGGSSSRAALKDPCRAKEKQKRKRNIMNETQITMLEGQLKHEPDMQRKPKLIREWTELLKEVGPEVTENQLKNWLNNRKQRLARLARGLPIGSGMGGSFGGGSPRAEPSHYTRSAPVQGGDGAVVSAEVETPAPGEDCSNQDSAAVPSSAIEGLPDSGDAVGRPQPEVDGEWKEAHGDITLPSPRPIQFVKGQEVVLLDQSGRELGIGTIDELEGIWRSKRLDEQNLCLVEVTELKVEKETPIPYPSQRGGATFGQAEALLGIIMVFWNMNDMRPVGNPG